MHEHSSHLLSSYFAQTNWHSKQQYAHLTHSTRSLLDFAIPSSGLIVALSHRPTTTFLSGLTLSTLSPASLSSSSSNVNAPVIGIPVNKFLAGHFTYAFSSAPIHRHTTSSRREHRPAEHGSHSADLEERYGDRIDLKEAIQSFEVDGLPLRPALREEVQSIWDGGERTAKKDYFLYGRLYVPSRRLDALYVHRLSPTVQTIVSLVCVPSPVAAAPLVWAPTISATIEDTSQSHRSTVAPSPAPTPASGGSATAMRESELEIKLQHDTGKWNSEYSYALGDGMWGMRGLYNFGKSGSGITVVPPAETAKAMSAPSINGTAPSMTTTTTFSEESNSTIVDSDESSGLRGRWSAGGEVYFSAQERSAGVSTGVQFTTLPEPSAAVPLSSASSAPSFSSSSSPIASSSQGLSQPPTIITATLNPIMGHLSTSYAVAISRETALCSRFDFNMFSYDADLTIGGEWLQRRKKEHPAVVVKDDDKDLKGKQVQRDEVTGEGSVAASEVPSSTLSTLRIPETSFRASTPIDQVPGEVVGVIKFRASTNTDVALAWEGRLGSLLVSIGMAVDLHRGRKQNPIKSVGIGIQYWG